MKEDIEQKNDSHLAYKRSIVDVILDSKPQNEEGQPISLIPTSDTVVRLITAKEFFTDNDPSGFILKKSYLKLLATHDRNELNSLEALLELMNEGAKINAPTYIKKDFYNRDCMFCVNRQKRGDRVFKFLVAEDLRMFLGLYQFGLIKCQLSLESLFKEALILSTVKSEVE